MSTEAPKPAIKPPFRLRPYARAMFKRRDLRMFLALWLRQGGKTTTLAVRSLWEMAAYPGRLITFASASLLVGREVIEKEAQIFRDVLRNQEQALREAGTPLSVENADGKDCTDCDDANFAELFESQRMSVRLKHPDGSVSRTLVIAPNPATARGFTGSVIIDECGWIKDFRDVWDAMEPIFSSDPTFNCILATTPPADDTHYSHELIVPPPGTEWTPCAEGNWYESAAGVQVHRVDVHDAALAGVKLYDRQSAAPLSPEDHRAQSLDRESWDRNYKLSLSASGTAAVSRLSLERAMSHPESARCFAFDEEAAERRLREIVAALPANGVFAFGFDVGTTEGKKSNPSSLTLGEKSGSLFASRIIWRWKTKDDDLALSRVKLLVRIVCEHLGRSPKALCIDASSEKYFANRVKRELAELVKVVLVVNSENLTRQGQTYNTKQYLGDIYTVAIEDGHAALPNVRWLFDDHRLVRKEKGRYDAAVAPDGCHADSFDSNKLSLFGLESKGGAPFAATFNFKKSALGASRHGRKWRTL